MVKSKKEAMKIISLEAQNVLKLKTVRITPDGSAIIIGGKNAQGKSSILNCIMSALGGKSYVAEKAVREGEKKGFIELDLGKYKVKRTFTESGGGTVVVETPEGARFTSPQQMLDSLLGTISFDPLSFSRMKSPEQIEILKRVSGVDTSDLDREHNEVYESRADFNREVKRLEGVLSNLTFHDDAPAEPVSMIALADELDRANTANQERQKNLDELETRKSEKIDLESQISALEEKINDAKEDLSSVDGWISDSEETIEKTEEVDTTKIREKMGSIGAINLKISENVSFTTTTNDLEEARINSDSGTERIDSIKDKKLKLVASSDLPIENLLFDDSGITFQDIPFDQASDAEKLRVSVALGLAMNPELKVMLIRDGSLLDEDNLGMITKMAEDAGGQVWIERVGEGKEMTIIMEDGEIKK